jgi:hypothetical protein
MPCYLGQWRVDIENAAAFIYIAQRLGTWSGRHTDYPSALARLASVGLTNDSRTIHETN